MASRAWWACALGGLAGCTYIFDPVSDFTDESATDIDTDTSDTDVPEVVVPELRAFDLTPRLDGLQIHVDAIDPQHDLDGGQVVVSNGTEEYTLAIPGGLLEGFTARGMTQREMVKELNRLGVPAAQGGPWSLVQLQRVLKRLKTSGSVGREAVR